MPTKRAKRVEVSFDVTKGEDDLIRLIVERAAKLLGRDKLQLSMDITACHANGNRLRLEDLLTANDFNFAHDVVGINNNINRNTGKLDNFFSPRFSEVVLPYKVQDKRI